MILRCFLFLFFLVMAGSVSARTQQIPIDSLTHHELGEIVVSVNRDENARQEVATVHRVLLADIAQADAASIDGVLRTIPGAHIQTNSRGETLIYLRNAGERQTALFFDGALLNVLWDNRIDLNLVPADVVGEITVAKGVPSVLYGANVLGGALNMTSRTLRSPGTFTRASMTAGSHGSLGGRIAHLGRRKQWGYTFSTSYSRRGGIAVPGAAVLPFSQQGNALRTNTDQELLSVFGRLTYDYEGGARIGVTLLGLNGEKGIAPEGHVDPGESRVRFWRYPSRTMAMAIVSGQYPLGDRGTFLRGAIWGSQFSQRISQFGSVSYTDLLEEQRDDDGTIGARLVLLHPWGPGELGLAVNALTSRHAQYAEVAEGEDMSPLSFHQHVWSSGFEYTWNVSGAMDLVVGASLDGHATPDTGDKPSRPPQVDYGVTSGLSYHLDDSWSLRAALGRKVRFPTMRELFGEALGRFQVNPDLRVESSLLTEVAVGIEHSAINGEIIAFLSRTYDTIDQRVVQPTGEGELPRRMRVNLEGSRVVGLEMTGAARFGQGWRFSSNLAWIHTRAAQEGVWSPLVEKPEWLGMATLHYNNRIGLSALVQTVLTGSAYGLSEDNAFVSLPSSLVINARLTYISVGRRVSTEIFARVNNVTDEVTLPQLGLPGPGRDFQVGLELSF